MTGHPHQPSVLYHYTCVHSAEGLRKEGIIKPGAMLVDPSDDPRGDADPLVWLTDLPPPVAREWLGLTRMQLRCDRLAHVFAVEDLDGVMWYPKYARLWPGLRQLERQPGVKPAHWFVSEQPVPVAYEVTCV